MIVTMATAQPIFLRQAKIGQKGSKEHVDRCRTMHDGLHDGRIKLLIYAPFFHICRSPTSSKLRIMTLLYKPIDFNQLYSRNSTTCQKV